MAVNYSTSRLVKSLAKNAAAAEGEEAEAEASDESDDGIPQCQIIEIPQARRMGVLPIAFTNGEEFTWYDYSEDEDGEELTAEEMEAEDEAEAEEYYEEEEDAEDDESEEEEYSADEEEDESEEEYDSYEESEEEEDAETAEEY